MDAMGMLVDMLLHERVASGSSYVGIVHRNQSTGARTALHTITMKLAGLRLRLPAGVRPPRM